MSNATAAAEFNVFHDPGATAVVLDASADHVVPVTMYGLDVFYGPRVTLADAEALAALDERGPGALAAGLVRFLSHRFRTDSATIGDAGAVAVVIDPSAVRTERLPVRVELAGTWTRGRTIVDTRDWTGDLDHDPHGLAHEQSTWPSISTAHGRAAVLARWGWSLMAASWSWGAHRRPRHMV